MAQNIEQAILDSIESGRKKFVFGVSNNANLDIDEVFKKLSPKCKDVFCLLDPQRDSLPSMSTNKMMEYLSGVLLCDQDTYTAAFTQPNKYLLETYGMSLCYHDADTGSTIYSFKELNNTEFTFIELFTQPNVKLIG